MMRTTLWMPMMEMGAIAGTLTNNTGCVYGFKAIELLDLLG